MKTPFDPRPSWGKAPETGLRVTWLGHSTLLVELDGVRALEGLPPAEAETPTTELNPHAPLAFPLD